MAIARRFVLGLFVVVVWNAVAWGATYLVAKAGLDAIHENQRHAKYADGECWLTSQLLIDSSCLACTGQGPRRITSRRRRSSCTKIRYDCYQVRYGVSFEPAGELINASTVEPAHSVIARDCDRCVADYHTITDKYAHKLGERNATVACHWDKDDPAGSVVLTVVSAGTANAVIYLVLAGVIGLVFGGVGLVMLVGGLVLLVGCDDPMDKLSRLRRMCCSCCPGGNRELAHTVIERRSGFEEEQEVVEEKVPPGGGYKAVPL